MDSLLFDLNAEGFGGVNFAAGIWECNLYGGPKTYPIEFQIRFPDGFQVVNAVASLGVSDYFNVKLANNMHFRIDPTYKLTYDKNLVVVTGSIYVGDSDAGVRGISYFCAALGKFG